MFITVIRLAITTAWGPKRSAAAKITAKLTEIEAFLGSGMVNESATKMNNAKKATSAHDRAGLVIKLAIKTTNAAAYTL